MNPWRWVDPRVGSVRVADIRAYLLGRGWKAQTSPNPRSLVFERSVGTEKGPFVQVLPASEDFSDYIRLIAEFITTLSEVEDRHPVELLNDILRESANGRAGSELGSVNPQGTDADTASGEPRRGKHRSRPA